ncbi:preprotein translocase, SecE subunit [Desulfitobacterium dichloroeliminans LMG P-21439]|uniref:Protein translocase subunit SecE n=1 Tax=Desulfitobacterium dichloroeliminans (strain LMG P-21439 / DCA1) TaxID=871963 RepID=L0F288_DESDL|nr:preprotein translocase subunit SecE [Desulfitobacterium dichloroeliminans]AGA67964.1 preprotein translocase, SecE subunit [Desulfitobacterium dichloroeliminans LMG P-21439]
MGAVKKQTNAPGKEKQLEYFKGVWSELKKVHWPDRKQLLTYTGVVLIAVAFVAVLLWIVDSGFSIFVTKILG